MGVGFEGESIYVRVSQVELVVENPPANAGNIGDAGSIPGSRRSLGQEDPWRRGKIPTPAFLGFPGGGSDGKESACNAGNLGLIPGLGRSPGGGNGYPL